MIYVFYDEPHWGAAVGTDKAVQVVQIINSNINRNFIVQVSPGSMLPKDDISIQNMASTLWNADKIDPLTAMRTMPNLFPDPNQSAKLLMLYLTNPQLYAQMIGVPAQQPPQVGGGQPVQGQPQAPPTVGGNAGAPPQGPGSLSQVPINR